jgi:aminopeptidase N
MIGSDLYDPLLTDLGSGLGVFGIEEEVDALAFVVAHEAAHQWWYSLIGNDAYAQPWLDESLTNWSAAFYIDETSGLPAGALARDLFIRLPYLSVLSVSDQRLDQPVDRFDGQGYAAIVYGKGALMYDVLRAQLGDAPFFEFLRRYAQTYEFRRADGDAWRETLAQVAGPDVAEAFYRRWVESDDIQEADLPPGGPISELLKDPDLRELFPPLFE